MGKKPRVSDEGVKRLAFYFYRANLMRGLTHEMRDYLFAPRRRRSTQSKHAWEFFAYLEHWLSALFVVVEGFNKLKMHDARVQSLFKENIQTLKAVRHETYHFTLGNKDSLLLLMRGAINWAEELHDAIGDVIADIVHRRAKVEAFLEYRTRIHRRTGYPSAPSDS